MKIRHTLFLLSVFFAFVSCESNTPTYTSIEGIRYHTSFKIVYQGEQDLREQLEATISRFDESLNDFNSQSLISKINGNRENEADTMLLKILRISREVSEASSGVYDITGAPYFDIWGFGLKHAPKHLPTKEQLDSISEYVGYKKVSVEGNRVVKADPRVKIHAVSLSKGYLSDLLSYTLEENGISNYLVEFGGEIVCRGTNSRGDCWIVGVNKPIEDSTSTIQEIQTRLSMCGHKALATSGDYRNFKLIDGKKVAHTMDVKTGRPAHTDILSATVLAPSCIEADAWATAFMALGFHKSLSVLRQHENLAAYFIYVDEDNKIRVHTENIPASTILTKKTDTSKSH